MAERWRQGPWCCVHDEDAKLLRLMHEDREIAAYPARTASDITRTASEWQDAIDALLKEDDRADQP